MHENKKLIICCGGTGGHFYPGLSVAEEFQKQGGSVILFLTGKHSQNQSEIAKKVGVNSIILPTLPLPLGIAGKMKFLSVCLFHILKNIKQLKYEKANYMLCMGSFNTVPSALAARFLKIPLFLHDGNSFIGKANKLLSKFSVEMGVAFPPANEKSIRCPVRILGMPLRKSIYPEYTKEKYGPDFLAAFNRSFDTDFKPNIPIVLIFGGSQGAKTFNTVIPNVFAEFKKNELQIVHLTGKNNYNETEDAYRNVSCKYKLLETTSEMGLLYSLADLVISRSGGSTVAELALYGKSAILIPYPFASEDHQTLNAQYYVSKGTSVLIPENKCEAEFKPYLSKWLKNKKENLSKAKEAKKLAFPNATQDVIKMITKIN